MYTLDINTKDLAKQLFFAFLCLVTAIIYEKCSYGEYSWFMRLMFLFPLVGGAGLGFVLKKTRTAISLWSRRFWISGLAVLTCGCLVHGIISISGRTDRYSVCYVIAGVGFLILACFSNYKKVRKTVQSQPPKS